MNTILFDGKLSIIREDSNDNQNNVVIEGSSDEVLSPGGAMIEKESNHSLQNSSENQKEDSDKKMNKRLPLLKKFTVS